MSPRYAALGLVTLLAAVHAALGPPWWADRDDASLIAAGSRALHLLPAEPWRLLTAPLLHRGGPHLLGNSVALLALGVLSDGLWTARRWLLVFTLGALAGGLLAAATGVLHGLGASPGAVALTAALARQTDDRALRLGLLTALLIDAVVGVYDPSVDLAAHLGGLFAGLALSRRR